MEGYISSMSHQDDVSQYNPLYTACMQPNNITINKGPSNLDKPHVPKK
jgi:hypothetical protein